jgi:hypothetical protein
MFASRFVPGSLLIPAVLFALVNPSMALLPSANANAPAKNVHHLDSLHKAAHELKHAHTAVNGKNGGKASQHVAAAIGHIEEAIQHHKANHLNQTRTGLSGAIVTTAHHHHHNQLHEALHAAKAAEKQLAAGNTTQAAHDISKAHHHVELAIHSHHTLIGN